MHVEACGNVRDQSHLVGCLYDLSHRCQETVQLNLVSLGDWLVLVLVDELDDSFEVALHVVDGADHHVLDRCNSNCVVELRCEVRYTLVDLELDDALLFDSLAGAADVFGVSNDNGLFETGLLAFFV